MSIPLPSVRSCVVGVSFLLVGMCAGSLLSPARRQAASADRGDFLDEANVLEMRFTNAWESVRGEFPEGTPEHAAARRAWRLAVSEAQDNLYARHGRKVPKGPGRAD